MGLYRRSLVRLAAGIPRSVWDPMHHNEKWVDSFAKPIADRRVWPAKRFRIGLEPQTPTDWLEYSKRNLAYAYNGALRACSSFPDMIPLYDELKQRGVQPDLDTLFVMLSRAARYEGMRVRDVFALFDELCELGARHDLAVVELLHTVWDHAAAEDPGWRVARRRQLIDLYNALAMDDVVRYGQGGYDSLMLLQLERYRTNLRALSAVLRTDVWSAALSHVRHVEYLASQLAHALWDRVPADQAESFPHVVVVQNRGLTVPVLDDLLCREPVRHDEEYWGMRLLARETSELNVAVESTGATSVLDASAATLRAASPSLVEDVAFNQLLQSALARLVDFDFQLELIHPAGKAAQRRIAQLLFQLVWQSGVMMGADVGATLMDILKYSPVDRLQDTHALRYLHCLNRTALRAEANSPAVRQWRQHQVPRHNQSLQQTDAVESGRKGNLAAVVSPRHHACHPRCDARVVARYLASRDPWSRQQFELPGISFPVSATLSNQSTTSLVPLEDGSEGESVVLVRTAEEVSQRWASVQRLLAQLQPRYIPSLTTTETSDDVDLSPFIRPHGLELFTGLAVFLRRMLAAQLQERPRDLLSLIPAVFDCVLSLSKHLDALLAAWEDVGSEAGVWLRSIAVDVPHEDAPVADGPEVECWESILVLLRTMLDALVQSKGNSPEEQDKLDHLYARVAELWHRYLTDSKVKWNGKFDILWLQEA